MGILGKFGFLVLFSLLFTPMAFTVTFLVAGLFCVL